MKIIPKTNRITIILIGLAIIIVPGCKSPQAYRQEADDVAYDIIARKQKQAFGDADPFDIRRPAQTLRRRLMLDQNLQYSFEGSQGIQLIRSIEQLPENDMFDDDPSPQLPPWLEQNAQKSMLITLEQALQIAARNSNEYQNAKENVFIAALDLDLEEHEFRTSWAGFLGSQVKADFDDGDMTAGVDNTASVDLSKQFKNGMILTAQLGVDLVKLLTGSESSSLGSFADASIAIPLARGSGEFVVTEPLKQAERNVIYELYQFKKFRRDFAVRIASEYLNVLELRDRITNEQENYRGLIASARRARRLADKGRLSEIQVDQAVQDELRARTRWIATMRAYSRGLDSFKMLLGLPTDATIELDETEFDRLKELAIILIPELVEVEEEENNVTTEPVPADAPITLEMPTREGGGPLEIETGRAVEIALENRLDLRVAIGRVDDAQRKIVLAADNLRADMTLLGTMSLGERRSLSMAGSSDANLSFEDGSYSAVLGLDLPLDRTSERNLYRGSWINLERSVRSAQDLEDQIKFDVRQTLGTLIDARENLKTQILAVKVAQRRVDSTELFLELERVEIRDVLDARESLITAENARIGAIVRYRITELEFQRDLGVLEVAQNGLWTEYKPTKIEEDND